MWDHISLHQIGFNNSPSKQHIRSPFNHSPRSKVCPNIQNQHALLVKPPQLGVTSAINQGDILWAVFKTLCRRFVLGGY
jgi:hypothetical protein